MESRWDLTRKQFEAVIAEKRRVSVEWYLETTPKIVRNEMWKSYRKGARWELQFQKNKKDWARVIEIRSRINASY
jgi:hypothetical protein